MLGRAAAAGNRPSQSGPDSRELEALQRSLLSALRAASADSGAGATYPGAVVSLAYLNECADEVELRAAEEAARVEELLRPKESVQVSCNCLVCRDCATAIGSAVAGGRS